MGLDPVTSTVLGASVGLSALGTGMKVKGNIDAGREAREAYEYNASLAKYQSQVAEQNVELISRAGQEEIEDLEGEFKTVKGLQETGYSKAGVKFEGTPAQVMLDSAKNFQYDVLKSKYNTGLAIQSKASEAKYYETDAEYKKWLGKQVESRYRTSAGTSLLGGVGDLLSSSMKYYPYIGK